MDTFTAENMKHIQSIFTAKTGVALPARTAVRRPARVALPLAAALALVLGLGVAAYAADLWGIRELWSAPGRELPEAAEELIAPQGASAAAEGWSARVTESLCDGDTVLLAVTVSGGDKYILAPTDAAPEDLARAIGLDGDETLADFAAARGKTLLFVGAGLPHGEALGIAHQSQTFRSAADNELAILIQAETDMSAPGVDTVCTVYALEAGSAAARRVEIPVTLNQAPVTAAVLAPEDPDAVPGLHIGAAEVSETALGVSVRFTVDAEDDAIYGIGKMACDELSDWEGGLVWDAAGGVWNVRWTMGQGSVGDTLTVHFYRWNGEPLGGVTFRK